MKTMTVKALLFDRVLVIEDKAEDVTDSGLVIPDTAKEKRCRGKVIMVGPGARDSNGILWPVQCVAGDTIIFSAYGGTEVKIGGEEYLIIREPEIFAVLEEGE